MCVNNGIADAVEAMANIEAKANSGRLGTAAETRKEMAPMKNRRDAAQEGAHPRLVTTETTNGVSSKPRLLPPATAAFHKAPE